MPQADDGEGKVVESITVPKVVRLESVSESDEFDENEDGNNETEEVERANKLDLSTVATAVTVVHRRKLRKTMLVESVVYTLFLAVFTIFLFSSRADVYAFYFSDLMKDVILREEFGPTSSHVQKTFYDIGDYSEFWQWMEGPLIQALYKDELYEGKDLPQSRQNAKYVFGVHRRVGTVRLRQMRVAPDSCLVPPVFSEAIQTCYGHYSDKTEGKEPFEKTYTVGNVTKTTKYTYSTAAALNETFTFNGRITSYSGGGYVVDFPFDRDGTLQLLDKLKAESWIDLATRAVMVDFTVYNPSINLFLVARVLTEFPATGGAVPFETFRVVKIFRYVTSEDNLIMGIEICLVVFVLYYVIEELSEAVQKKRQYFRDAWNYLDILNLFFFMVVIMFRVIVLASIPSASVASTTVYYNFQYIGYLIDQERNLNAVNAFLCYFKIFKYLQVSPRMNQLSRTLSTAGWDLGSFLMMFFIVFFGYALSGHVLFGRDLYAFHTIIQSMFSLFIAILGDFDFHEIQITNRYLGPAFFITFQILVFFILMNMFIAIIVDSYGKVKDAASKEPLKMRVNVGQVMKRQIMRMRDSIFTRITRVEEVEDAIAQADVDGDNKITRKELETALRTTKKPRRPSPFRRRQKDLDETEMASRILSEFDNDGNDVLDEDERRQLEDKLAKEKDTLRRLDSDMKIYEGAAQEGVTQAKEDLHHHQMTLKRIEDESVGGRRHDVESGGGSASPRGGPGPRRAMGTGRGRGGAPPPVSRVPQVAPPRLSLRARNGLTPRSQGQGPGHGRGKSQGSGTPST